MDDRSDDGRPENLGDNEQLNISQNPSVHGGGGGRERREAKHKNLELIGTEHKIDLADPRISKKFTLGAKMKKVLRRCSGCCRKPCATVESIRASAPFFSSINEYFPRKDGRPMYDAKELALRLEVSGTGILEMDQNVLHPFVRVHIVDLSTNKYLQKSNREMPGIANKESCNFFRIDADNKETKVPEFTAVNFLLPFSTRMFDLRVRGNNYCEWNEDFIINENLERIFQAHVVIMFEVLDFVPSLIVNDRSQLRPDNLYPVAWAYLRPLGSAQVHAGKVKLQLYKYKYIVDEHSKYNNPLDPRTPDVLVDLTWPDRELYNSFLEIDLSFVNKSDKIIPYNHISRAPWEEETTAEAFNIGKRFKRGAGEDLAQDEDDLTVIKRLKRWHKFGELQSELPDRLVRKFEAEAQGCFRLKFSHRGKYLAAACTLPNHKTIIKIFDVEDETDNLKIILKGHNDLIHDLDWDRDDNFLVSASADGAVRIWNLTEKDIQSTDRLNYGDNDYLFFMGECFHPSYVYGAKIHPASESHILYIATICFDGLVRIWRADVDIEPDDVQEPECVKFKSICDDPQYVVGSKQHLYQTEDNLEDEALRKLLNPQDVENTADPNESIISDHSGAAMRRSPKAAQKPQLLTEQQQQELARNYKMLEKRHPNCLTFDNSDRIFVGDNIGRITVIRVSINYGNVDIVDHFELIHKEMEGDEINQIIPHPNPENVNQLFVQSRDNCIRAVTYESAKQTSVDQRYFGAKCSTKMVRCALSRDGKYLVSGSETGQPSIWDASLGVLLEKESFALECRFNEIVPDVDWNPVYNMFAVCGFGQEFPILLYAFERTDAELEELDLRYRGLLTYQYDYDKLPDLDDPQNQEAIYGLAHGAESERDSLRKPRYSDAGRRSADFTRDRDPARRSYGSNEYRASDQGFSQKNVRFGI